MAGTVADDALTLDGVCVTYERRGREPLRAVIDVDLRVPRGATFAIIGESGSGKSSLARTICGLTPNSAGKIRVGGTDVTGVDYRRRCGAAGTAGVGIVFQNPLAALDPRWPLWRSIDEASPQFRLWRGRGAGRRRAVELLNRVGLPSAAADRRPHELSGGQLQRATIARALAADPRVMLFDEVVSALDVSVRNEILSLLDDVRREFGLTSIFISHDMSSVVQLATHIGVMYLGWLVEYGPAAAVIRNPQHPYTRTLLAAVPQLNGQSAPSSASVTESTQPSTGCVFRDRCPIAGDPCQREMPAFSGGITGHDVRCYFPGDRPAA